MNRISRLFPYITVFFIIALFSGDFVRLGSLTFQIIAILSLTIFVTGFWSRVSVWAKGGSSDILRKALASVFSIECLFAYRLFSKSMIRGLILVLTIWSFSVLTIGSICLSLEYLLRTDLTSSGFFSLSMDIAGSALLLSILFYLGRRLIVERARQIAVMEDMVLLFTFLLIVITGFANEGLRLAYMGVAPETMRPAGALLAGAITSFSHNPAVILRVRDVVWKIHALLSFFLLAYIPFSKQFHMFAAQIVTKEAGRRKRELRSILHE
ncbi:MAG: respiratory nitrate reductase subunit gamma [Candidatus Sulfobium sp.]|jgi:nitrate reductase gamma subunit